MIGKYLNNLKKIELNSVFLFLIVLLLFIIANLLLSIDNSLAYIAIDVSKNTANSYATLLEISNKNNTSWSKDKLNKVKNNIKTMYEMSKQ